MRRLLPALGLAAALMGWPASASAWQTTITDASSLPPEFVAVDKSSQRLFLLARRSPLAVEGVFPSIHGRVEGDKQVEGDLRTPEGVYFVRGKIQAQLDFDEYGSQAHALNYPNPVDRLRGKTGYGIWIHSKGRPIATQKTQGCIAIDLADIDRLAPRLTPGTPVLVAQRVDGPVLRASAALTAGASSEPPTVASAAPSSSASSDPGQFTATDSTSFPLSGAAPVFQTAELNPDASLPTPPTETPEAIALPAEPPAPGDAAQPTPSVAAEAVSPSVLLAANESESAQTPGQAPSADAFSAVARDPSTDEISADEISSDLALPSADETPIPALTEGTTEKGQEEAGRGRPNLPILFDSSALKSVADETHLREVARRSAEWNRAWSDRSPSFFDFYEPGAYTKTSENFSTFKALKSSLFERFSWISIEQGDISVLPGPGYWVSWFTQYYRAPNLHTEGIRRLYWMPGENGELKIVAMEWLPKELGLHDAFMKRVTPAVLQLVEDWRKAWEDGDLERYAAFYRPGADQGNLKGLAAILDNKKSIWARKKPARVEFQGTMVYVEDRGVRVRMTQLYSDSSGYHDKGVKELLLYPQGDSWRIASESWTAIREKT